MAVPSAISVLYAELNKLGQTNEYDRAVKVANKILSQCATDACAFQCKVVCLIQLSKFEDALTAMRKQPQLSSNLQFEQGYSEYRLNRCNEALKTLKAVINPDERIKELLAQVLYRLEDYSECLSVYRDLVRNTQDDYEEERETNMSAVLAALQLNSAEPVAGLGLRTDTYELAYNNACFLIAQGQLDQALEQLTSAEELCRASFEDDADAADDLDAELAVIRVQRGYVLQLKNRPQEATKLYNTVMKNKPSDLGLAAVASNNIVTLNKDQNVFDSKKKIKVATADGLQTKLTSDQRRAISMNHCLLLMHINQGEQCQAMASTLRSRYPTSDRPALIQSAQLVKEKHTDKAIQALQSQVERSPSVNVQLAMAQLYLSQGHVYQACTALQTLPPDLANRPGIIATLITLYLSQNKDEDRSAASEALQKSVSWYRENDPSNTDLVTLIRANAQFQLKYGDPRVATEMLEDLRKRDPSDVKTLAQLISAYSQFDQDKAEAASRSLPSASQLAQDVDVDALETALTTYGPKYIKKASKADSSPKAQSPGTPEAGDAVTKKKRNRKGKLPKDFDPNAIIDPERWIAKRERSYYKGKRRDKRKEIGKGPQGAVSQAESASLDASKRESPSGEATSPKGGAGSPQPSSTPNLPLGAGPRQQKPGAKQTKKKKGKGGKW